MRDQAHIKLFPGDQFNRQLKKPENEKFYSLGNFRVYL